MFTLRSIYKTGRRFRSIFLIKKNKCIYKAKRIVGLGSRNHGPTDRLGILCIMARMQFFICSHGIFCFLYKVPEQSQRIGYFHQRALTIRRIYEVQVCFSFIVALSSCSESLIESCPKHGYLIRHWRIQQDRPK
jgi:hypothetical protein